MPSRGVLHTRKKAAVLLMVVVLSVQPASMASQTGSPGPATRAPSDWRTSVGDLLAGRARAVETGDRVAFSRTMTLAPAPFQRRTLEWFSNVRALPLGSYALTLSDDGYDDLAGALQTRPSGDEVHVVQATSRLALRDFDPRPSAETMYLTVVRRGRSWSVTGDNDLAGLGLLSSRSLWDFAPARALQRSNVLVLEHARENTGSRILDATVAAAADVKKSWPLVWNGRVIVVIPGDVAELGRILQTTLDLGPFVAFTTSSVDRTAGAWRLVAHRVYVQPATFYRNSVGFRTDTLRHELLHVATRADASMFTPAWLDEGVAQVYGERARQRSEELARRVRSGVGPNALPPDEAFAIGSRADIAFAYQASADLIAFVRARYGRAGPARLYRALGREMAVSFGTRRYHLDHASRVALGVEFSTIERAWFRHMTRSFG